MCFVFGASLFVLGLVILCLVYFLFVVVWLSVPVQSIAWKDGSRRRVNVTFLLLLFTMTMMMLK